LIAGIAGCVVTFGLLAATPLAAGESTTVLSAGVTQTPPAQQHSGADYVLVPRKPQLGFYPCSQCHQYLKPNPEKRELLSPHPHTLDHGGNRFWCLTCHDLEERDQLRRVDGQAIDFDNAPELCASCHMARYRDWKGGAHGKRIANWQGERVIWACPACHNPHSPTIKPRAPKPPPPVRRGLVKQAPGEHGIQPVWERRQKETNNE